MVSVLRKSIPFITAVFMLLMASVTSSNAAVLYAAPSATGNGDCTDWSNVCTLTSALLKASYGDRIWVRAGVHKPSSSDRKEAFVLKQGVNVYGGFNGTETSPDQRDWQTNVTILSGDIDDNDVNLDGNYIAETPSDIQGNNSLHVVLCNPGADSLLDGFVITAGKADDYGVAYGTYGGGMINFGNPSLINIIFRGNYADMSGGAIENEQTAEGLSLTNVRFISNIAYNGSGGAIYDSPYSNHDINLSDVDFIDNQAGNYGGAIEGFGIKMNGEKLLFSGNIANNNGGGISCIDCNIIIKDATFTGNSSGWYGGAISTTGNLNLLNVRFIQNSAYYGGAIWADNLVFTNGIISRNTAEAGAGIYINTGGILTNLSFSGNSANSLGGAIIYHDDGASDVLVIANSILSGDTAGTSGPEIYRYFKTSVTTFTYSDIRGCGGSNTWNSNCGTDGGGNIDGDPVYLDPLNDDLRVYQATSPVIDAGNNSLVPSGVLSDIDGNSRFVDLASVLDTGSGVAPIVDMGAHEAYKYSLTVTKAGNGSGTVNVSGCSIIWNGDTGRCTLDQNVQVTLIASADAGSAFSGWSGTGSASGCTSTGSCIFTLTEDTEVTATFTPTAVKLLSPNGGEVIPSGGGYEIKWQAPPSAHHYTLKLSMDNGMTWTNIATNVTGNTYNWNVQAPANNKRKCLIKVIAYDSNNVRIGADRSDAPFTIEVIRLHTPDGGEILSSEDSIIISWTINQTKKSISKQIVSYTLNGGLTWMTIIIYPGGISGSWSTGWTVPTVSTTKTKCKIKVVLKDSAGNTIGSDLSDGFFTLKP